MRNPLFSIENPPDTAGAVAVFARLSVPVSSERENHCRPVVVFISSVFGKGVCEDTNAYDRSSRSTRE
jgi:hypothetical protein